MLRKLLPLLLISSQWVGAAHAEETGEVGFRLTELILGDFYCVPSEATSQQQLEKMGIRRLNIQDEKITLFEKNGSVKYSYTLKYVDENVFIGSELSTSQIEEMSFVRNVSLAFDLNTFELTHYSTPIFGSKGQRPFMLSTEENYFCTTP